MSEYKFNPTWVFVAECALFAIQLFRERCRYLLFNAGYLMGRTWKLQLIVNSCHAQIGSTDIKIKDQVQTLGILYIPPIKLLYIDPIEILAIDR